MPIDYSSEYKSTIASVNAPEAPIMLMEIDHPALSNPVRVVNDTQDITSNGNLYIACAFRYVLPDDFEGQLPKAKISVDNIGGELMYWIETSNGGNGSIVTFKQIMRSRPDLIESEIEMDLQGVVATMEEVSGELGYENLLSKLAVSMAYRPENSPGLF
jgi:hypothetical protein